MKTSEITEMTVNEIVERIETEKQALSSMKFNHHISPLDNPLQIRQARKNIARMLTILRQKQLNEK
mgnify:CR=1 FL=1